MQPVTRFLTGVLILSFLAGCGGATKDIGFLKELADDEKDKAKTIENDTRNYEKLKEALASGKLKPGMPIEEVRNRFGEPVVSTQEKEGMRLGYKPGPASWFGEQKIYLFFDDQGKLLKFQSAEKTAAA